MDIPTRLLALLRLVPATALRIKECAATTLRVLWSASFAFINEEALIRASSLAFTSLLSLVPLLTFGLRIMNFYGVSPGTREEMEAVFARYLLPTQSREIVALVVKAASEVTQNVGAIGLIAFCFTLVLTARELEGHILKICHQKPTWWTSVIHYTAFVTLVPTGVIFAFLVFHPLVTVLEHLPGGWAYLNYPFLFALLIGVVLLRGFSNYVLSWRACTFGALAAGVAAGASWKGCTLYFANSAAVSAYGALSFVYAFLLWVFVAWCCILFGVQVAAKTEAALTGRCVKCE
jgi:membrane protein